MSYSNSIAGINLVIAQTDDEVCFRSWLWVCIGYHGTSDQEIMHDKDSASYLKRDERSFNSPTTAHKRLSVEAKKGDYYRVEDGAIQRLVENAARFQAILFSGSRCGL